MVPVTGGYPILQETPGLQDRVEFINVQWDFIKWPDEQYVEEPPLQVRAFTEFGRNQQGADEALLRQCHGQWTWHSCRNCEDPPLVISGGRLMVGTVFAARFDCLSLYDFSTVEAFVKFRINLAARQSRTFVSINDGLSGNVKQTQVFPADATWLVGCVYEGSLEEWDKSNLRVVLDVQGTITPANVGRTVVDVEWFAIRLSNDPVPPPE